MAHTDKCPIPGPAPKQPKMVSNGRAIDWDMTEIDALKHTNTGMKFIDNPYEKAPPIFVHWFRL